MPTVQFAPRLCLAFHVDQLDELRELQRPVVLLGDAHGMAGDELDALVRGPVSSRPGGNSARPVRE